MFDQNALTFVTEATMFDQNALTFVTEATMFDQNALTFVTEATMFDTGCSPLVSVTTNFSLKSQNICLQNNHKEPWATAIGRGGDHMHPAQCSAWCIDSAVNV